VGRTVLEELVEHRDVEIYGSRVLVVHSGCAGVDSLEEVVLSREAW
jgi:hypothetical protein